MDWRAKLPEQTVSCVDQESLDAITARGREAAVTSNLMVG